MSGRRAGGVLLLLLAACGESPRRDAAPTWSGSVGALVQRRCGGCHAPGGPAPFPLLARDDLAERGGQVRAVVESGFMPPWLPARPRGAFVGERALESDERAELLAWLAAGAPAGSGPAPVFEPAPDARRAPDLRLVADGTVEVPAEGLAVLHTVVLPLGADGPRALAGLQAVVEPPGGIHGVAFACDPGGLARKFDLGAPGAGYRSPGSMGPNLAGHLGGHVPGARAALLPDGWGRPFPAGGDLLVQLHLYPRGRREPLSVAVDVWLARAPLERVVTSVVMGALGFELAPGEAERVVRDVLELPVDVELVSLLPLARYACTQVAVRAVGPDGAARALLEIDDFDHNWLEPYVLREPLALAAGTRVELAFTYDNSAANPRNPHHPPRAVGVGMAAGDELCFLLLELAPRAAADLSALEELHRAGFRSRAAARDRR